ncbi:hypothetical protein [Streptomyces avermitilis]|uniref:hypothetical protein n=1 Tax=Streptomyces avermitilis TaxID=33903 RepID=UPI0033B1BF86
MLLVLSGSAVAAGQIFKGSPGTAAALLLVFLVGMLEERETAARVRVEGLREEVAR